MQLLPMDQHEWEAFTTLNLTQTDLHEWEAFIQEEEEEGKEEI